MSSREAIESAVAVTAENVGGIDRSEVAIAPGVTVLTGRNATNRTSFLQALMAALGSEKPSLKADADRGRVELELDDETYTRTLTRQNGGVQFGGDPYLDDPELADLFAFLVENNDARRAVERGDDLREVIMRPIDTDEIERRIDELETEKRQLDREIERLESLENDLPDLESKRRSIETELDEKREELAAVEDDLAEFDADPEESRTRKEELESVFAELRETRSDLEDVEFDIETERATVDELEAERDDLESTLAEADDEDASSDRLDGRIEELRARKRSLDETISELQSVIGFNEEMLEDDGPLVDTGFERTDGESDVTDRLLEGNTTVCWTCGSEVDTERIEETLDRLRELRKEKLGERNDLREQIDELTDERDRLREQERERERADRRLERIDEELADSRDRIERLEDEREELEAQVEELEATTEEFEETDYSEVLDHHRDANRLELEIERLESNLEEVEAEIANREDELGDRESLRERRDEVQAELTDMRTRVERIEEEAIEAFNEHIASILDILEYENIDRIWIDRREREVREGRRKVERTTFDLHVVRATDGTSYRDTVDHLSESEREVTGLVFALAGYLVHDVYEEVPFMLLDSLEAIDSERIAAVVDYFEEYVDQLVVALLPEDARTLPDDYAYVTEI